MVYRVHVTNPDGSVSRFDFKCDGSVKSGDFINPGTMIYKALRIEPDESDRFDAIVEAEWVGGPAQVWRDAAE